MEETQIQRMAFDQDNIDTYSMEDYLTILLTESTFTPEDKREFEAEIAEGVTLKRCRYLQDLFNDNKIKNERNFITDNTDD